MSPMSTIYSSLSFGKDPLPIIIIGLGHRTCARALPALMGLTADWTIIAACDTSEDALASFREAHPNIPAFNHVHVLLEAVDKMGFQGRAFAYVAVPPFELARTIPRLLEQHISVINEKPAATSSRELGLYQQMANKNFVQLLTASQSRYGARLMQTKALLPSIGLITQIHVTRTLSVADLSQGWRSSKEAAGGVLCDLGWHVIDNLVELGVFHDKSQILQVQLLITRPNSGYNCEDTVFVAFRTLESATNSYVRNTIVTVNISRSGHKKAHDAVFTGTKGILTINDAQANLYMYNGPEHSATSIKDACDMRAMFLALRNGTALVQKYADQNVLVTRLISKLYDHSTVGCSLAKWPVVDTSAEYAVVSQLHTETSIYNNSGVTAQLEQKWKELHGHPEWHALLHNSGTNAIHGLFAGARLRPGDEVIFPVYTFHATCSPAMQYGITPVFCDCDETGNLDPSKLAQLITSRTRVVIVTHMWGMPCEMSLIQKVLTNHPGVLLFEDCSHAHGASIDGQLVGTFGDGAAWSLQGPKIISGGEGGILLTRHKDLFEVALLNGHYNKRCFDQLAPDSEFKAYAGTGVGLKHRSHPLANALALQQADQLHHFLSVKQRMVELLHECVKACPFLEAPVVRSNQIQPAWYAYVAKYKAECAPKYLSKDLLCKFLKGSGVTIVDIPRSTRPVVLEPLFSKPAVLLPHLYGNEQTFEHGEFPGADCFYEEAIKFDVGALDSQVSSMEDQIGRIKKALKELQEGTGYEYDCFWN